MVAREGEREQSALWRRVRWRRGRGARWGRLLICPHVHVHVQHVHVQDVHVVREARAPGIGVFLGRGVCSGTHTEYTM